VAADADIVFDHQFGQCRTVDEVNPLCKRFHKIPCWLAEC
jgi:hypothetical protein